MRCVYLAASAAILAFAASPAAADEGCCRGGPVVVYGAPPVAVVVQPTGYVLDPSDAWRPSYRVDDGGVYPGPWFIRSDVPTYSEGGYAYPRAYPYVRSYFGDYGFTAPRLWHRPAIYGRRQLDRPRVVRAGVGYGHLTPPYHAYHYRPAPSARVINVLP